MTRPLVLVTDYAWPSLEHEEAALANVDPELVVAKNGDEAELVELARNADAILTNWIRVPPSVLDAAPRCLVVSRYGIGVDNIPVERATELGILVANTPGFCVEEVSDHVLALVFACARRIVTLANSTQQGRWDVSLARGAQRLRGQTIGLVGFGSIAQTLAAKAAALGLRVLAYTPRIEEGVADGVETTRDLARVLAEADYLSLHAPATDESRGLIGEGELRAMKPTAFLVNTARGALVDEAALLRALDEGWIAGAALDVLATEPPRSNDPLLGRENVIVTPHAAFYSETSVAEVATRAARNVALVLEGGLPDSVVNPQVLDQENCRLRQLERVR
jgi:D-3-phosphoglycerate dehydrogenase